MGVIEKTLAVGILAALAIYCALFPSVEAGCLPRGTSKQLEYKCERMIITSYFCNYGVPMDECFNRYRYNNFTLNFHEPPTVMSGIESWDVDRRSNSRLDIDVVDVNEKDATIRILTWKDSHSYSVRTTLLACGFAS